MTLGRIGAATSGRTLGTGIATGLVAGAVLAALAAMSAPLGAMPRDGSAVEPESLSFKVLRDGVPIGRHSITFTEVGDELHVDVAIDLEVTFAFLTLFRYEHRNKEIWRDGRLVSLESRTDDDGKQYQVSATATAEGLWVEGSEGRFLAPADTLPTSYWNPATVEQRKLLDTQRGGLLAVSAEPRGVDAIAIDQRKTLAAQRYKLHGDLNAELWYAPEGDWMKIAFEVRGSSIDYQPIDAHRGLRRLQQSSNH